jgi:hypothetical protein
VRPLVALAYGERAVNHDLLTHDKANAGEGSFALDRLARPPLDVVLDLLLDRRQRERVAARAGLVEALLVGLVPGPQVRAGTAPRERERQVFCPGAAGGGGLIF